MPTSGAVVRRRAACVLTVPNKVSCGVGSSANDQPFGSTALGGGEMRSSCAQAVVVNQAAGIVPGGGVHWIKLPGPSMSSIFVYDRDSFAPPPQPACATTPATSAATQGIVRMTPALVIAGARRR